MSARHGENRAPSKEVVIFVEGMDEVNVFDSILSSLDRTDVQVLNVGGKEKLAAQFKSAINATGFSNVRAFGIVQDADDNPVAAFERVKYVLSENKFNTPNSSGEVVASGNRNVGILILPSGNRNGYLEDLFLDAYKDTPVSTCVESFATCSEAAGCTPFNSKRRTHAFLAALDATESRLGRAFESGKINGGHTSFDVIRNFLGLLT